MPTYSLSARNQFRSPSGAVGEAPDGPGGIAALRDDVDNFLGVGGAEYCANAAAMTAIPSSRKFLGKLAYRADLDTVFRYVGAGGTALGSNDSTHLWQAWTRPPKSWTPTFGGGYTGAAAVTGSSQIVEGRIFLDLYLAAGSGFALTSGDLTVNLGATEIAVGQFTNGSGYYQPSGLSGSGQNVPLVFYTAGALVGQAANFARIRVPRVNSATSPQNLVLVTPFAAFGAGTTTDSLAVSLSAPSALVA